MMRAWQRAKKLQLMKLTYRMMFDSMLVVKQAHLIERPQDEDVLDYFMIKFEEVMGRAFVDVRDIGKGPSNES